MLRWAQRHRSEVGADCRRGRGKGRRDQIELVHAGDEIFGANNDGGRARLFAAEVDVLGRGARRLAIRLIETYGGLLCL